PVMRVRVRRVYQDPEADGAARVLVDRLWPRGVAKEHLNLDHWAKDAAPSTELRKWYGHRPERFDEFRRRYLTELEAPAAAVAVQQLPRLAEGAGGTLLTGTRESERSVGRVPAAA